jgi:hypothetical protein
VIKEQNASLQIHVLHLQEEINETQGKIRKVRDVSTVLSVNMIEIFSYLLDDQTL